jgi:alpha-L-fucosidase
MPPYVAPLSRRQFIATASAAATGAAALPLLHPAVASAASPAEADDPQCEDMQALLSSFVDMRFGMFIHYSLGTYTTRNGRLPTSRPPCSHRRAWTVRSGPARRSPPAWSTQS